MGKNVFGVIVVIIAVFALAGCRGNETISENVSGKWSVRYEANSMNIGGSDGGSIRSEVSINVNQELSESEYENILENYEKIYNTECDEEGKEQGEKDIDYFCYAVFYKGNTSEVVRKIKYHNHNIEEYDESEEIFFPQPEAVNESNTN